MTQLCRGLLTKPLIAVCLGLSVCVVAVAEVRTVKLDAVERIQIYGDYEVHITQGKEEYVKITADRDELSDILARIRGDQLIIGINRKSLGFWMFKEDADVRFDIQLENIKEIALESRTRDFYQGSERVADDFRFYDPGKIYIGPLQVRALEIAKSGWGELYIDSLRGETIRLRLSGAPSVALGAVVADDLNISLSGAAGLSSTEAGSVREQRVNLSGESKYAAPALASDKVSVQMTGRSRAEVKAGETLDADISGEAKLVYHGNPKLNSRSPDANMQRAN